MIIVVSCFWLYSKVFHFWETCRLPSFFTRHLQAPKNNLDCPHRPTTTGRSHDAHSRSPADDRRPDPYRLSKGKPMKDTENRPQPRKRRKWGSVIVRRDADGNPTSFQARYVNPLDPPKKVGRNFGLEYETEAYRWLGRGALPRHTPQQRHQAMGSSIAARRKHHAHIQGILQGLLRQIPQTGRQQAIRPVQPM